MNSLIERFAGFDKLTDQIVAMDLLTASKSAINMYAAAATEAATPEIKETMRKHLFEAVNTHEQLTAFMMRRGFCLPYDVTGQIRLDRTNIETALSLPS